MKFHTSVAAGLKSGQSNRKRNFNVLYLFFFIGLRRSGFLYGTAMARVKPARLFSRMWVPIPILIILGHASNYS